MAIVLDLSGNNPGNPLINGWDGTDDPLSSGDWFGDFRTAPDIASARVVLGVGAGASYLAGLGLNLTGSNFAIGNSGGPLTDPNADRMLFWDDSAGGVDWLQLGTNLSITGTVLNAAGGGGGGFTQEEIEDFVGALIIDSADLDFTYADATPSISGVIKADAVTYAKMQNVSATDKLLGRSTAGAGDVEEITCTAFGRSLIDDAASSNARTTLGLVIGTDVQGFDADLSAIAGLTSAADRLPYFTGAAAAALATYTAQARTFDALGDPNVDAILIWDDSASAYVQATVGKGVEINGTEIRLVSEVIHLAASDEGTALTTGTNKIRFRLPYAYTLLAVRASLSVAQTSGSIFTVDVNEAGTTVLSTKLTIDNTEQTSVTAATAAVISDANLADDAEISIDIDQVGDGTAKGLKVLLYVRRAT